jgi:hypothetical protein
MASSMIRALYDKATLRHHLGETKDLAKEGVTSVVTGALLGLISAKRKGGLDINGAPIDAGLGAALMAGSIFMPTLAEHRETARQVGGTMLGVGTFRMSERFNKTGKLLAAHGELDDAASYATMGEDPIVAAAKLL